LAVPKFYAEISLVDSGYATDSMRIGKATSIFAIVRFSMELINSLAIPGLLVFLRLVALASA
jgi:hypothetical protein